MDLVVRPWTQDDAPALSRAIAESLDHLRPWMHWIAFEPQSLEQRRAWISERTDADKPFGLWLGDRVVGGCGLHHRLGPDALEIGYWVHPEFTRRGIATAAVHRLCEIAFARPGIDHVEIHHDRANVASGRVAAAAGFTRIGERPRDPDAPAHEGVDVIWRLSATAMSSPRAMGLEA